MKVKIYGSRGSAGFSSKTHIAYGGNSVCTAIDIDGHIVVIDCGTGLMQFYADWKDHFKSAFKFDILLSHLHIDHIVGISTFPPLLAPDSDIRIFTNSRSEEPLASQVFGIFRPPYWPIVIGERTKAKMVEVKENEPFSLGDGITVTPFFIKKHDDAVLFRIDADKSIVYLLDYEVQEHPDKYDRVVELCRDADLVIFDAAYMKDDYARRRGWGHSTFEDGMALADASGCKRMIFSHLSQDYSDDVINSMLLNLDWSRFLVAYDGMETEI